MKYYMAENIISFESKIYNKLSQTSYKERKLEFKKFNIYNSWWSLYISPTKKVQLTYRRFLQLINIFNYDLTNLFSNTFETENLDNLISLTQTNEDITKIIKITKLILKKEFENKKLKKTTFLLNSEDTESDISTKTLTRIFNQEYYTEFKLITFLIILDGLQINFENFLYKMIKENKNEFINKN